MDKNSNVFTVVFAIAVCVVLAVCLAATYNGLKSRIDANAEFDRQRNVLLAMGLVDSADSGHTRSELEVLYGERVEGKVLQVLRETVTVPYIEGGERGERQEDQIVDVLETEHPVGELDALRKAEASKAADERRELIPIFRGIDSDEQVVWCIPISGYGLWGTLYGYLGLEGDLNTVRGITFYKHKETPGLGGEVDNADWKAQWEGKYTLDEDSGKLVGVIVKKGVVNAQMAFERDHMVDGLAGATITGNGVTRFVRRDLATYARYFDKQRKP